MTISVIIPVYGEEDKINEIISRLKEQANYSACEIEVVFCRTDEGVELSGLESTGSQMKIRFVMSGKGRGLQMNTGTKASAGDVLLFLHADSVLPDNAFGKIKSALSDTAISGGAFSLRIDVKHLFLKAVSAVTNLRCRLNRIPYGDQAFFIRKDIFDKIGGFKEIPIMEDVELMRRIRNAGLKIAILKDKVTTSARRWEKEGFFYTTIRNRFLSLLYTFGVKPEKLANYYRPHSD